MEIMELQYGYAIFSYAVYAQCYLVFFFSSQRPLGPPHVSTTVCSESWRWNVSRGQIKVTRLPLPVAGAIATARGRGNGTARDHGNGTVSGSATISSSI
jgi:hypothetical protein